MNFNDFRKICFENYTILKGTPENGMLPLVEFKIGDFCTKMCFDAPYETAIRIAWEKYQEEKRRRVTVVGLDEKNNKYAFLMGRDDLLPITKTITNCSFAQFPDLKKCLFLNQNKRRDVITCDELSRMYNQILFVFDFMPICIRKGDVPILTVDGDDYEVYRGWV